MILYPGKRQACYSHQVPRCKSPSSDSVLQQDLSSGPHNGTPMFGFIIRTPWLHQHILLHTAHRCAALEPPKFLQTNLTQNLPGSTISITKASTVSVEHTINGVTPHCTIQNSKALPCCGLTVPCMSHNLYLQLVVTEDTLQM